MAITYEELREALAKAGARWYTDPRARGVVPQHALGLLSAPSTQSTVPPTFDDSRTNEAIAQAITARRYHRDGLQVRDMTSLPRQVDWRNHLGINAVTSIKDQQGCGSCVGFAACALMESMLLIEHSVTADLCENEFFFCNQFASCNGWYDDQAINRCKHEGAVVEHISPYTGYSAACPHVANRDQVRTRATTSVGFVTDVSRKTYLNAVGPMTACFNVYEDFDVYAGGVYVHTFGKLRGGHCVLVIGYDDEFMCWICKNSWGPHFGEGGFFRIAYGQDLDSSTFRGVSGMQLTSRWQTPRAFLDRYSGTNATDVLLYNGVNGGVLDRWRLAEVRAGALQLSPVADLAASVDLDDGRPIWTRPFLPGTASQLLFHSAADDSWWLGAFQGYSLAWMKIGSGGPFGSIGTIVGNMPSWTGYFSTYDRAQMLTKVGDSWWLGTITNNQLQWSLASNTSNFSGLAGATLSIWVGDFNADGLDDLLAYNAVTHDWFSGSVSGGTFTWALVGNTAGFGNLADGRPFWTGYFHGVFRTDLLFYSPAESAWWLGTLQGRKLQWAGVGNTAGFGQVWDGRPFWVGDFDGSGSTDMLFYDSTLSDMKWWLGTLVNGSLQWTNVGDTTGFGQVWDGRPFYAGQFSGAAQSELLFNYPIDGNWFLGRIQNGSLAWTLVANTRGAPQFE